MSALIFRGDQTLSETMVLAYTAQQTLSSSAADPAAAEAAVVALLAHLRHLATLDWWFIVHNLQTAEEAEALRRELLAHRDYVQGALFVTTGAVGDAVAWQLEHSLSGRVGEFTSAREGATVKLRELEVVLKFLLEEEDPAGDVERLFSVPYPPPQPKSPSVDFDFN